MGVARLADYSASKAAVIAFHESLVMELGASGDTVNDMISMANSL